MSLTSTLGRLMQLTFTLERLMRSIFHTGENDEIKFTLERMMRSTLNTKIDEVNIYTRGLKILA